MALDHYINKFGSCKLVFGLQMVRLNPYTVDIVAGGLDHSVGRVRREAAEQEIPEELLVVQSIKISDKFGFRGAQTQTRDNTNHIFKKETNSLVSSPSITSNSV